MNKHQKAVREEAARWFARMQNSAFDHPDRSKFEAWLVSDQAHTDAYHQLSDLWQRLESKDDLNKLAQHIGTNSLKKSIKKKSAIRSISHIALLVIAGVVGFNLWQSWYLSPLMQLALTTETGYIKKQQLPDGTLLTLDPDTQLEITYYRNKRQVVLKQGEVILNVARDESRPFIIDDSNARVTVLGTRFVVNKLKPYTRVSVDHGRVKVESRAKDGSILQPGLVLQNGEVAEVASSGIPIRSSKSAQDAFHPENGSLSFEQANIEEIAETISRYRKTPVVAKNLTNAPSITALVQITNIETFLQYLPSIAHVTVKYTNKETVITSRQ